jgi:hypothetical protein
MHHQQVQRCEEEVLQARGIHLEPGTTFVEMVALTLRVPRKQCETFLESIYNGATVEQAASAAGLEISEIQNDEMIGAALEIGSTLSHLRESV